MESSTTNGDGHRGDHRVHATMRMKTVATAGAPVSCVPAGKKKTLSGGGSATRFNTAGTLREKEPRGRGGQRRWGGTRVHAKGNDRNGRTNGTNTNRRGERGHGGGRGSNMNILTNATAIRRPPPLAVDGVIWPDKHSPYGLQCATRCRYGKQIYRKIGTRKCSRHARYAARVTDREMPKCATRARKN